MKVQFDKAQWMASADAAWLMLRVPLRDATAFCDEMKNGKIYEADLKEHHKKRSLDANSYSWLLLGKIAAKVGLRKEDVYRELIRDVGDNFEIIPIRDDAVEKWIEIWKRNGIGWVCDVEGKSKLPGYTRVIAYYGSSTYDSLQMSRFIDLIVTECQELGIDTMTPAELALLMDGWKA